jgi:hypothetical protein
MSERYRYITLVTSLPHLGRIFSQAEVPLSRFRLKQRMRMLDTGHYELLEKIVAATTWAGVSGFENDADVILTANRTIKALKDYPTLQHLVGARMETRTIIAALRRRHDGDDTAGDIDGWGYGRWRRSIKDNWTDPAFGLSHFMPWVSQAHTLLASGDHIAMERLVLTEIFRQLDHYGAPHQFDFEAVAIYTLRWVIIERWSQYNTEVARERLEELVSLALGHEDDVRLLEPNSDTNDFLEERRS